MTEIKGRITKRFSGVVRRIFPFRRSNKKPNLPKMDVQWDRKRSLLATDRLTLTESAVWRHNVKQLYQKSDNQRTATMGYKTRPESDNLSTIRQEVKIYRHHLSELKREADILRRQRDGLCKDMTDIRAKHEYFQRRRSIAVSHLCPRH